MRATLVLSGLLLAVACGSGGAHRPDAAGRAKAARGQAAVPGVETAVVAREPMRDTIHAFGTVAADVDLAELRDAQAQLAQAEAKRRLADQQAHRLEELATGGVAPRKELEAARADATTAAAEVDRAGKALAVFGQERPHGPLGADESWLLAYVQQKDLGVLAVGAEAAFVADAFADRPRPGRIDAAPSYVDPATRTAPVRLRVQDAEHLFRPGMTGDVAIEVGAPHDALVVPTGAVVYDDAQAVVFVAEEGGRFTLHPVHLGIVRGDRIEITSGLEPGARIAVTGAASLLSATRLPASNEN